MVLENGKNTENKIVRERLLMAYVIDYKQDTAVLHIQVY